MHIASVIGLIILIALVIAGARYVTHSTGRHADRLSMDEKAWEAPAEPREDDTQQMSWTDRVEAFRIATERLADTADRLLAYAPSWTELWAESAATDALLNSGVLASTPWVK
jgi:hypothetical protein